MISSTSSIQGVFLSISLISSMSTFSFVSRTMDSLCALRVGILTAVQLIAILLSQKIL